MATAPKKTAAKAAAPKAAAAKAITVTGLLERHLGFGIGARIFHQRLDVQNDYGVNVNPCGRVPALDDNKVSADLPVRERLAHPYFSYRCMTSVAFVPPKPKEFDSA